MAKKQERKPDYVDNAVLEWNTAKDQDVPWSDNVPDIKGRRMSWYIGKTPASWDYDVYTRSFYALLHSLRAWDYFLDSYGTPKRIIFYFGDGEYAEVNSDLV